MRASNALSALVASTLSTGPTVAAAQMDYTEIPLLASDGHVRDFFGFAVSATNDYVAVYVFGHDEAGWGAPLRLTPSDPLPDKAGNALTVADRAVVGGAYAWPDPGVPNEYTGSAVV